MTKKTRRGKSSADAAVAKDAWKHVLMHHDRITEVHEADKKIHDAILREHMEEYAPAHSHSVSHAPVFRSHTGSKHHQKDLKAAISAMHAQKHTEADHGVFAGTGSGAGGSKPVIQVHISR